VRYERVHRLVAGLGARPTAIGHADHDRIMAAVSHLPHVVANVLVAQATDALEAEHVPATGPSFRDATRVAGANPSLWSGIYAANHEALAAEIDKAIERLAGVRDALRAGEDLGPWQQEALEQRQALLEVGLTGGERAELRVAVPNRPGVVADLALTLGRAGINISDMSLSPSPDNTSGEVALWVAAADADRAAALIADLDLHVTR
jgi:prephenate dehydrogenase